VGDDIVDILSEEVDVSTNELDWVRLLALDPDELRAEVVFPAGNEGDSELLLVEHVQPPQEPDRLDESRQLDGLSEQAEQLNEHRHQPLVDLPLDVPHYRHVPIKLPHLPDVLPKLHRLVIVPVANARLEKDGDLEQVLELIVVLEDQARLSPVVLGLLCGEGKGVAFGFEVGDGDVEEDVEGGGEGGRDRGGEVVDGDEGAVFAVAERGELGRDEGGFFLDERGFLVEGFKGEAASEE
jgi:hypothetical protein